MKAILTLLLSAVLFTACEKPKDYNCVCIITEKSFFGGAATTHEDNYTIHTKKRKAVRECDNHEPSGLQIWTKTDCAISN